jgi:FtsP/CotA-like multicopper oxidase with cupredoxin domain/peroxiredoxin
MSGALIIEGGLDNIPEIKAAKDRVMVLNQIPYIYKNKFQDPNNPYKTVSFNLPAGVVEAKYAEYCFGPGDWADLGRYTTINGAQLPVIEMQPGEIERWRLVDSGQRETIHLRLIPLSTDTIARQPIPLYQIAVDGLALGKLEKLEMDELWPGYRSDVLVKAPDVAGEYVLINEAAPAQESMNAQATHLNYVAKVIIKGTPKPMNLPTDSEMAGLRLPSIQNSQITGFQSAKYGILLAGNNVLFTIDGQSFQMETARELKLNDVDEWTITSVNDVGPVTHPFHIHVNPFEVTSIQVPVLDENGNQVMKNGLPVLKETLTDGPVWRDTVKIPGNGSVTMRTHYTDFIGTFVQHCHILDHEDQGMMQLIDIYDGAPPTALASNSAGPKLNAPAPTCTLPDAGGKSHNLLPGKGKPTVVFFFKGHACYHCSQQVAAFTEHYKEFQRRGIQVVGVTSDSAAQLKAALASSPCPFPIMADPKGLAFAKFGCVDATGLRHGTFALDANHKVVWRTIGASPYLRVTDLLKRKG